jgi:type I restriction enzyme R subunit
MAFWLAIAPACTGSGKEDTFVLDFENEPIEIVNAFQPYYEQTIVGEQAQPQQLYELQAKLNAQKVYYQTEVEEFSKVFYKTREYQTPTDHAKMNACIDPAVTRFKQLDQDTQEEFRKWITAYRNLYSFLSQVIPFQDSDLEKLYSYIRFLLTKLPKRTGQVYDFDDEIRLEYYRLQKISEGALILERGKPGEISGYTAVGTGVVRGKTIELSQMIDILNDRFGTDFKPVDQLFFDSIRESAVADSALRQHALANTMENFSYVFHKALEGLLIDRLEENEGITAKYLNEKEFQEAVEQTLRKQVYDQIHEEEQLQSSEASA